MNQVTYYRCGICHRDFDNMEDALECEASGKAKPIPLGVLYYIEPICNSFDSQYIGIIGMINSGHNRYVLECDYVIGREDYLVRNKVMENVPPESILNNHIPISTSGYRKIYNHLLSIGKEPLFWSAAQRNFIAAPKPRELT